MPWIAIPVDARHIPRFHGLVRRWASSYTITAALLSTVACRKESTSVAPEEDKTCSGARCVEKAEAAMYYQDYESAREPLEIVCKAGDGFQCFRLAELYRNGQGGPVDLDRAVSFYEASCNGKHGEGCERRADFAREGHGGPEAEFEFAVKACELQRPVSCMRAGEQVQTGRGAERDDTRAITLFQQGCRFGEAQSCAIAGDLLLDARRPAEDKARGLAAYVSACVGHNGYGCLKAAIAFHEGLGTKRDLERARMHFGKACDFNEQDGCRLEKALMASNGEPVELELTSKAAELDREGLEAKNISCRMSQLGAPALGEVLGAVASAREALDACAKDGAAVAVWWQSEGGKMRGAKVTDKVAPKLSKCVVAALRRAAVPTDAACDAILLLGDPDGAVKALSVRQQQQDKANGIIRRHVTAEDEND